MSLPGVSLVIPGRDCERTLGACLGAAAAILERPDSALAEILFVDDGSKDKTREIAERFPVRVIAGEGRGAGAARNLGWRSAAHELVWFVDSDCNARPDALEKLLPHLAAPDVGAVSGSYENQNPHSLLASMIDAEIVERHRRMGTEVDFLATYNVLYRRSILEELNGFDERYLKGQDAELSFRALRAGHRLRLEIASKVAHDHETRWLRYFDVQRQQGYWRVFLHLEHRGRESGDSYSQLLDHAQPPLAVGLLCATPVLVGWGPGRWMLLAGFGLLVLLQLPWTIALVTRSGRPDFLLFAEMSFLRSFWRGVGLVQGLVAWCRSGGEARRSAGHGSGPHGP